MIDDDDAVARTRYFTIQALRIAGVALVLVGILIVRGRIAVDPVAGYALVAVGLVDIFAVPMVLARKWRTPPE
ncbi:MAG: hypothetical protein ABIT09_09220 [Croceibacterium sp.]